MSRSLIDPSRYAALVREAADEDLAAGMRANRQLILGEIFRAMPASFRPDAAGEERLVVEWRIGGRSDGGEDRWQVIICPERCRVTRDGQERPQTTLRIGPVDFVKLVTGAADGPELFMKGRLQVEGDLLLAAKLANLFAIPDPKGQ